MDSSAEYGQLRPSPLGPLGMEGAQHAALEQAFGSVPPPYVSEAEALLDTGIQTMEVRGSGVKCIVRQGNGFRWVDFYSNSTLCHRIGLSYDGSMVTR